MTRHRPPQAQQDAARCAVCRHPRATCSCACFRLYPPPEGQPPCCPVPGSDFSGHGDLLVLKNGGTS